MRCIVLANILLCFFLVICPGGFSIGKSVFFIFNFIGLMQCSKILSVISSTDWERIIRAMKLHQYFEFGPPSKDPFLFCQIQLSLDTVQLLKINRYSYTHDLLLIGGMNINPPKNMIWKDNFLL